MREEGGKGTADMRSSSSLLGLSGAAGRDGSGSSASSPRIVTSLSSSSAPPPPGGLSASPTPVLPPPPLPTPPELDATRPASSSSSRATGSPAVPSPRPDGRLPRCRRSHASWRSCQRLCAITACAQRRACEEAQRCSEDAPCNAQVGSPVAMIPWRSALLIASQGKWARWALEW